MTCAEFNFSDRGRRGIGVIQPQSGLDYPFIANSRGLRSTVAPAADVAPEDDIRYLVADFFLAFDDPGEYSTQRAKVAPPLRIKYLYNVGCWDNGTPPGFPAVRTGNVADIVVVDANNTVVFDTTTGAVQDDVKEWGADYKIYSWKKQDQVCQLVAYTTWTTADDDKKHFCKYLVPVNAVLDARATYKMPLRVRTLAVQNGGNVTPPYSGKVRFRNGYNTALIAAPPVALSFRSNTRVVFTAAAASGLGKYPDCPEDATDATQPLKKINGVAPINGDLVVSANDCVWARRPVEKTADGDIVPDPIVQQQIGADCPPCCDCQDYVSTALYMNQVQSQYALIGSRVNDVKLLHEQNVARWLDQRECSVNPLKLYLIPQRCPYMDIAIMLCNPCQECIPRSILTLNLSVTGTTDPVVPGNTPEGINAFATVQCGYTALFAPGINGRAIPVNVLYTLNGTQLSAQFPLVRAGGSAYLKLRVKFSAKRQYAITGTLTGALLSGDPILTGCAATNSSARSPAITSRTEALFCTEEGATELPC
jgi:hypothetical protein